MSLKVIGPGWFRTGTYSTALALEQLGFGPCQHTYSLRERPDLVGRWRAVAAGAAVDFGQLFAGCRSQMDLPGSLYWRELARAHPEARVVLTVRDPDSWSRSVARTILKLGPRLDDETATDPAGVLRLVRQMADERIFSRVTSMRELNAAHAAHIEEVTTTIERERLPMFDVRDGWEPLCRFLGVAAPSQGFPSANRAATFNDVWFGEADPAA